jgi:hypothetical protein
VPSTSRKYRIFCPSFIFQSEIMISQIEISVKGGAEARLGTHGFNSDLIGYLGSSDDRYAVLFD